MNTGEARLKYEENQNFPDGRVKRIEISKIPLPDIETGDVIGLVGIYEDITDRQAEERAAYQNHIVRTIGHAIRGRIAALDAIYEQLKLPNIDHRQTRESLYAITRGLGRAARAATQLAAQDRPQPMLEIPLDRMVEHLCGYFIDPRIVLQLSRSGVTVRGVATDLENMFLELLSNARDFAPQVENDGKIWVVTVVEGPNVVLIVADNGAGIAPHLKGGLVFDLFTTIAPNRTGMGLSLVKRIVEKHGGTVTADEAPPPELSAEQTGARFVIRLPVSGKDEAKYGK
jgi:signal transduction histidine kinase